MLYLVGGASRAGKSTLAGRLCAGHAIPWFSLDLLRMGLAKGAPELGLDPENNDLADAVRMWPVVLEICERLLDDGRDYLIEGGSLRPDTAVHYAQWRRGRVRVCFLGHADIDLDAKFQAVKARAGGPHDWLAERDDDYIRNHLSYSRTFSAKLREACAGADVAYFDTGADFEAGLAAAEAYLVAPA